MWMEMSHPNNTCARGGLAVCMLGRASGNVGNLDHMESNMGWLWNV